MGKKRDRIRRQLEAYALMCERCAVCGCELNYGTRKADGQMYPRRKDKDGNYLDSNGWTKWNPKAAVEEDEPFSKPARR